MKTRIPFLSLMTVIVFACANIGAQQVADPDFNPPIAKPAYAEGRGPLVMIDESHSNFHTAEGRYKPFADLLRRDGYRVQPFTAKFSKESLKGCDILVIANAQAEGEREDGSPPHPSAFTDEEVASVREWVRGGGSLFLIVDHMPFPGAAEKLGAAFGAKWSNGYAIDPAARGPMVFKRSEGSLADHPVTNGRDASERVDSVATFTGSAFQAEGASPLLTFKGDIVSLTTMGAGELKPDTPRVGVKNWQQGALLRAGKGRVALFGEAAMFSAQLAGPQRAPMGMNAPVASQNYRLLLNVLHWLSGLLGEK